MVFHNVKTFAIILIVMFIALTIPAKANPTQPNTLVSTDYTNAVVISEINWAGSSGSTSDEWIELHNNSSQDVDLTSYFLFGVGNSIQGIKLNGTIKADSYFLLSNFSAVSSSTNLAVQPDQVSSSLSISNTAFDIKLSKQNIDLTFSIVDEVNTNNQKPFAGSTSPKISMIRKNFLFNGSDSTNWEGSKIQTNLRNRKDANNGCQSDFGSPKSANYEEDQVTKTIGVSSLCIDQGVIKNNSLELVNSSSANTIFTTNFPLSSGQYSIKIYGNFQSNLINQTIATLSLTTKTKKIDLQINAQDLQKEYVELSLFTNSDIASLSLSSNIFSGTLVLNKIEITKLIQSSSPDQVFDFTKLGKPDLNKNIKFPTDFYCLDFQICSISFRINLAKSNKSSDQVAKIFVGNKDSNELNIIDLVGNDFYNNQYSANFTLHNNFSPILIQILSMNNNDFVISDFKIEAQKFINNSTQSYISQNRIDWNKMYFFDTTKANGLNGQLVDVLELNESQGNHEFSYRIKKLEDFSSGSDLIRIVAFDESGVKIFDEIKDENDLNLDEDMTFTKKFNLKNPSKISVLIKFYGNYTGAMANIEFGKIGVN